MTQKLNEDKNFPRKKQSLRQENLKWLQESSVKLMHKLSKLRMGNNYNDGHQQYVTPPGYSYYPLNNQSQHANRASIDNNNNNVFNCNNLSNQLQCPIPVQAYNVISASNIVRDLETAFGYKLQELEQVKQQNSVFVHRIQQLIEDVTRQDKLLASVFQEKAMYKEKCEQLENENIELANRLKQCQCGFNTNVPIVDGYGYDNNNDYRNINDNSDNNNSNDNDCCGINDIDMNDEFMAICKALERHSDAARHHYENCNPQKEEEQNVNSGNDNIAADDRNVYIHNINNDTDSIHSIDRNDNNCDNNYNNDDDNTSLNESLDDIENRKSILVSRNKILRSINGYSNKRASFILTEVSVNTKKQSHDDYYFDYENDRGGDRNNGFSDANPNFNNEEKELTPRLSQDKVTVTPYASIVVVESIDETTPGDKKSYPQKLPKSNCEML